MESLQSRVESWIREQRNRIRVSWPQLKWPWKNDREQRKKLQEEYERRRKQLQGLCHAVKADSISDLQDILCAMVLSECVYKRPATEMVRAANKFKADFGGQVVSLERVQPSLDHVPHRYLLAEAGDTLFASFIGTKQYKDVIADANIFQGAIFHEDFIEDIEGNEGIEGDQVLGQNKKRENLGKTLQSKPDQVKNKPKPAAHRGFLARAKGIPALELYRLAQKKNRKLVLCGHSLGGAVAALATLAILRVIASSSPRKENENVQVKCITFSQPPVGNAALRDYVHREGWQHYFKTYCIPEDLVPRILSPAYFHHYNAQLLQTSARVGIVGPSLVKDEEGSEQSRMLKPKENDEEQLVLGLGPVQNSFWRLSRLVPLEGVRKQLDKFRGRRNVPGETSLMADSGLPTALDEVETEPQSLEIQEGSDGISLTPLSDTDNGSCDDTKASNMAGKSGSKNRDSRQWHRVPYLPSYVPFGQLYLVGNSSVESLSDSEYSKLTSVRSVLAELRERFQSHSMKSYRSRFQKCSTIVESLPPKPTYSSNHGTEPDLQKMRILIGAPLRRPPNHQIVADTFMTGFPSPDSEIVNPSRKYTVGSLCEGEVIGANGLGDFCIYCTSDFITSSKNVCVRTRRVRFVGLEGAGKTSLFNAILGQGRQTTAVNLENVLPDMDTQEGVAGGLCFLDSAGVNLQELHSEVTRFRDDLWTGIRDLSRKTDLIVLVHNLSHKIPVYHQPNASKIQPALSLLLNEAKALGIPWVLAITNKFSVSANLQKSAVNAVVQAYEASPSMTEVINSCPYVIPSSATSPQTWDPNGDTDPKGRMAAQKLLLAPINLVRMPFQKKSVVLPVEGVTSLCQLIHRVLRSHEETSLQELTCERLQLELAREQAMVADARQDSQGKTSSITSAAVGASLGAGLGLVLAVVMGAASALRKP
ncbi:uncharacterized protein LOC131239688 isoform X2 [Magnolia sinica]|uniref:uncharacterized protein LOC131239688 isoform X2 n=1 Tax=Magnolia sinica TaxID=86752 RepID=UPI00265B22A0|nr:uncharacterized protein LOC131239688 isoform X2 [Magnolia sinica]